jgi:hypothetical protein
MPISVTTFVYNDTIFRSLWWRYNQVLLYSWSSTWATGKLWITFNWHTPESVYNLNSILNKKSFSDFGDVIWGPHHQAYSYCTSCKDYIKMFDSFAFGVAEISSLELFTHLSVWIRTENEILCSIYLAHRKWSLIASPPPWYEYVLKLHSEPDASNSSLIYCCRLKAHLSLKFQTMWFLQYSYIFTLSWSSIIYEVVTGT